MSFVISGKRYNIKIGNLTLQMHDFIKSPWNVQSEQNMEVIMLFLLYEIVIYILKQIYKSSYLSEGKRITRSL